MGNSATWPQRALVGYAIAYQHDGAPSKLSLEMISNAIQHHYNVFVYAFGYIDTSNTVSLPNDITGPDLDAQIKTIHDSGGLALLSFGGASGHNTFNPGSDAATAAANTVALLQKHGFDGVDLDLEAIPVDTAYLENYMKGLRSNDASILITAAPQIHGGYGQGASLAPTDIFSREFLTAADFDALLVQNYNQRGGAKFDGKEDTVLGFITASFPPLTEFVPAGAKILVGEPANKTAGTGLYPPSEIAADIRSGSVGQNPRYGGIMTWALNYDADQNWAFADAVYPVVKP